MALPPALLPTPNPVRRTASAGARSVHEPDQPSRVGGTPQERAASLGRIVDWLSPATPAHKRYQKVGNTTFCNIYAHDYCHLGGVYIPRVWWNDAALAKLQAGQVVVAKYSLTDQDTVREMTANQLVAWLPKHGPDFGWRNTLSLTELQDAANGGAVVIITAQHKLAGHHGHIVAVVPETAQHRARRDGAGNVTAPLQSQAGAVNFNYGAPSSNFWTSNEHKNPQFWIHD
jgi:hypothetical protein